ncbi:MAG: hypothetical protein AAF328_00100 [Planctomycetota bacterium]
MFDDVNKHRSLMLLLVRLLGIFFFVDGVIGLLGNGIALVQNYRVSQAFYQPFEDGYGLVDGHAVGWTIGSAFALVAGLLLIFKSDVAMEAIYHEKLDQAEPREGT